MRNVFGGGWLVLGAFTIRASHACVGFLGNLPCFWHNFSPGFGFKVGNGKGKPLSGLSHTPLNSRNCRAVGSNHSSRQSSCRAARAMGPVSSASIRIVAALTPATCGRNAISRLNVRLKSRRQSTALGMGTRLPWPNRPIAKMSAVMCDRRLSLLPRWPETLDFTAGLRGNHLAFSATIG